MIKIFNKLKQPLSLNLDGGRSLILLSKEQADLSNAEFLSPEVQSGIGSEDLLVISMDSEPASTDSATQA